MFQNASVPPHVAKFNIMQRVNIMLVKKKQAFYIHSHSLRIALRVSRTGALRN